MTFSRDEQLPITVRRMAKLADELGLAASRIDAGVPPTVFDQKQI